MNEYTQISNTVPHSLEGEQSIIGSLLLAEDCRNRVVEILKPEHFYNRDLSDIYVSFCEMFARKEHIDMITLSEYLLRKNHGDDLLQYLGDLVKNLPSSADVMAYVKIVIDRWHGRQIIFAAENAIHNASSGSDYEKCRQKLYEDLEGLFLDNGEHCIADGLQISNEFLDELERLNKLSNGLSGWSTGDKHLDEVTGGLNPGDFVTVAGRSGSGKTTKALNLMRHFIQNDRRVLMFCMEMKKSILAMKLCSDIGSIPFAKLKKADLDDVDWHKVSCVLEDLKESKLHIDDSTGLSIEDIERKARQLKAKYGSLDMIVLDFIQRLKIDTKNMYSELTAAANRLKDLFMELDCCGIVLAQLKKNSVGMPNASDLKETGAIEEASDVVIFIHTPSPDLKPHAGMQTLQIFNKVRLGETGIKMLENQLQFQRFVPVDGEYTEEDEGDYFNG
jgi:replicative DNA helicase